MHTNLGTKIQVDFRVCTRICVAMLPFARDLSQESVSVMYLFGSKPRGECSSNGMECAMFDFCPLPLASLPLASTPPPPPLPPPPAPPIAMHVAACRCRLANSSCSDYCVCFDFPIVNAQCQGLVSISSKFLDNSQASAPTHMPEVFKYQGTRSRVTCKQTCDLSFIHLLLHSHC